ncbi:hypothetical protein PIIN_05812 [Serendipita indica DSM 11827]|uniref:Uncharacterized protein n=1 Tax=Serendipita indica (strain DSM 11827) TaxID=1109443 RepID=G4TKN1_SERID|nr:hypothetical protein PIIN_05812 [Serendipita indica DSM 11827]
MNPRIAPKPSQSTQADSKTETIVSPGEAERGLFLSSPETVDSFGSVASGLERIGTALMSSDGGVLLMRQSRRLECLSKARLQAFTETLYEKKWGSLSRFPAMHAAANHAVIHGGSGSTHIKHGIAPDTRLRASLSGMISDVRRLLGEQCFIQGDVALTVGLLEIDSRTVIW